MENFSTPQRALVPWAANLATLVVVVSAIGWSNGQRHTGPAAETAANTPTQQPGLQAVPVQAVPVQAPGNAQPSQAGWPAKTTALPADGLQVVGFTANRR